MKGIGVSPGIAISKVYIYNKTDIEINNKKIKNFENEIKNLENSLKDSKNQLDAIIKNIRDDIGDTEAEIFEAQKMILSDIEYINQIKYLIENEHLNAAFAINKISNKYIDMLNDCDNEYIKQRITDIKDISQRIIGNLAEYNISNIDKLKEDVIIIANDLTPSELVLFEKDLIKGFVTEKGGSTSHSAILANTMGIPAIIGVDNISDLVNNEENII